MGHEFWFAYFRCTREWFTANPYRSWDGDRYTNLSGYQEAGFRTQLHFLFLSVRQRINVSRLSFLWCDEYNSCAWTGLCLPFVLFWVRRRSKFPTFSIPGLLHKEGRENRLELDALPGKSARACPFWSGVENFMRRISNFCPPDSADLVMMSFMGSTLALDMSMVWCAKRKCLRFCIGNLSARRAHLLDRRASLCSPHPGWNKRCFLLFIIIFFWEQSASGIVHNCYV